jgi:hypothetical protein
MSGREQEPWQRRVRRARELGESGSWDIRPGVETPRQYAPPVPPPAPEPPRRPTPPFSLGDDEAVWGASASFGKLIGVVLIALAGVLLAIAVWRVTETEGNSRLLALAAAVMFAIAVVALVYLQRGLYSIRYVLGDDHLTIAWLNERHTIPFEDIRAITYDPRGDLRARGYERFWPGFFVSTMQMRDGVWHSVATQEPGRRIRFTTSRGIYAISPERPVLFLSELARRRQGVTGLSQPEGLPQRLPTSWPQPPVRLPDRPISVPIPTRQAPSPSDTGPLPAPPTEARVPPPSTTPGHQQRAARPPTEPVGQQVRERDWLFVYRTLFRERLLGDQVASGLLAVGVMLPLLMIAFLYSQYEGIPASIPLHWNAHGEVDQFGTRRELWRLPLLSVVVLVFNTLLATLVLTVDRFLARFLTAATLVAQAIAFIALIRAVI